MRWWHFGKKKIARLWIDPRPRVGYETTGIYPMGFRFLCECSQKVESQSGYTMGVPNEYTVRMLRMRDGVKDEWVTEIHAESHEELKEKGVDWLFWTAFENGL